MIESIVKECQVLDLKPGNVLWVSVKDKAIENICPGDLHDQIQGLRQEITDALPGIKVIVVSESCEPLIVQPNELFICSSCGQVTGSPIFEEANEVFCPKCYEPIETEQLQMIRERRKNRKVGKQ